MTNGQLGAAEQVVVTGHSLGGFLAQAFTARHDSVVSSATPTIRRACGGLGGQLLDWLGIVDGSIANGKIDQRAGHRRHLDSLRSGLHAGHDGGVARGGWHATGFQPLDCPAFGFSRRAGRTGEAGSGRYAEGDQRVDLASSNAR